MSQFQKDIDNPEAREVRKRSEFLRTVTDFAKYVQKEYISTSEDTYGLVVSAVDKEAGNGSGKYAVAHVLLGKQKTVSSLMENLMETEAGKDLIPAGSMETLDPGYVKKQTGMLRRYIRVSYAALVFVVLWAAVCITVWVTGLVGAWTSVSSLMLTAICFMSLLSEIRYMRNKARYLKYKADCARQEMLAMKLKDAVETLIGKLSGEACDDDGEDWD